MMKLKLALFSIFLICQFGIAQTTVNQLFSQGNYEECIKECEKILKDEPKNGQVYYFMGASLVRLKKFGEAESNLIMAIKNGFPPNPANANLLRVYAGLKQENKLFELLNKSADEGMANYAFFDNSPEFDPYRENKLFKNAYKKIYSNAFPCISQKDTQRLDFWIGEWDIFNPGNDSKVASSVVSKSRDGCTLYEDYEHSSGFFGRSMNYYDPADSLYKQVWVDLRNRVSKYIETESKEGFLTMQADLGGGTLTRTTWTYNKEDDTVLQAAESSSDQGETWSPGFTGIYKRKKLELSQLLEGTLNEMESLFNENKMQEIADYYTDDAQMLEPGGIVYSGKKAIKDYWMTLDGNGISWELDIIEANEASNLAYSVATSNLKYLNGGKEAVAKTKALIIWEKMKNGDYKIKKDFFHFIK